MTGFRQCEGGVTSTAVLPTADGGSTPTSSLQSLAVEECTVADVRAFIEEHHYSKSIKGVTPSHCFKVLLAGRRVGAAIFGLPSMRETIEKYGEFGRFKLLELRRFVMIDDTPRNSESKSIGIMLKLLKKHGVKRVLSYADPNYGHVGTIYRATGFTLLAQTPSISVVLYRDPRRIGKGDRGRKWSTRIINRYADYRHKDAGLLPSAREIREALTSGEAIKKKEVGKFVYVKDLR